MDVTVQSIDNAAKIVGRVVTKSPLQLSKRLSARYGANIYIKREDLQEVRSFKIRGAYHKIALLTAAQKKRGVVCASAGNHAQGVAWSCAALRIHGTIFMPAVSPNQKVDKVKQFGGSYVSVVLVGNTFDEAYAASQDYCAKEHAVYVHPFNDPLTISGQGTAAREIIEELGTGLDMVLCPVGGGGLISGTAVYMKAKIPGVKVVGAEPEGAAKMAASMKAGKIVTLPTIDTFVDGAALKTTGDLTFHLCQTHVDRLLAIPEGKVCTTMIELYQSEGIVAEPAGALSIAALDEVAADITGKTVVCILSGGNNDILRYPEIMERSLVYQGRKHYFIVNFAQKPGQLRHFLNNALGPHDDIVLFEYVKKTNKEKGPALVGIELRDKEDHGPLLRRMDESGITYREVMGDDMLYGLLI